MSGELDLDTWAALSARLTGRTAREEEAILAEAKLDPAAWERAHAHWMTALVGDLEANNLERPKRYGAISAAELKRRRGEPPPEPEPELDLLELAAVEAAPPVEISVPSFAKNEPFAKEVDRPPPLSSAQVPVPVFAGTIAVAPATAAPARAVPFGDLPSPEFAEYLASRPEDAPPRLDKGATVAVPPSGPGSTVAAPAGGLPARSTPFAPGVAQVAGFTVEQYASLTAELSVHPDQAAAVLSRYGLADEAARKNVADAWGRRLMQEPTLLRKWTELCETYRAWLMRPSK